MSCISVRSVLLAMLTVSLMSYAARADVTVEENIAYGRGGETELTLDLARPEGDGPFPAIVFIHGGGWYQGSRHGYRPQIMAAARRGYVAATISYRLMKFDEKQKDTTTATANFPAQIHDAKAAIRWLRANADKYKVDPDRIGVTGGSAGGHLSLLVGLTDAESNLEGDGGHADQSSRVQAVVNVFGPTDIAACYQTSSVAWIFRLFMGGTPDEAAETYRAASPITYDLSRTRTRHRRRGRDSGGQCNLVLLRSALEAPNHHELMGRNPRCGIGYYYDHPLNGYRRLNYMMLDAKVVASSPSTVYNVLNPGECHLSLRER